MLLASEVNPIATSPALELMLCEFDPEKPINDCPCITAGKDKNSKRVSLKIISPKYTILSVSHHSNETK